MNTDSRPVGGSAGVGFISLLTIAFIVLKLCGVIDWSWWWVVSPIWISVALVVVVSFTIGLVAALRAKKRGKHEA